MHELFLTGSGNFRKELATLKKYKGNRDRVGRPVHYQAIRDYMVGKWNAKIIDGQEADDEIGIRAMEIKRAGGVPVIVSIDKDLKMIPCTHYNWVTETVEHVTELEAWRNFYKQCLTGDRTDNIPGIEGIGDKRAEGILEQCASKGDMYNAVDLAWYSKYKDGYIKEDGSSTTWDKALHEVKQLLWIRRSR